MSRTTVQDYFHRVKRERHLWTELLLLQDAELNSRFFHNRKRNIESTEPDAAYLHGEMNRRWVALMFLRSEYIRDHPNALPLPKERFLFNTCQKDKVGIDYRRRKNRIPAACVEEIEFSASYYRVSLIPEHIAAERKMGDYLKALDKLGKVKLLILDDLGSTVMTKEHRGRYFPVCLR